MSSVIKNQTMLFTKAIKAKLKKWFLTYILKDTPEASRRLAQQLGKPASLIDDRTAEQFLSNLTDKCLDRANLDAREKERVSSGLLPRISIVTPSYNQGPYVEWTIRSVFLQNYPNLEYIVMDGGSKDETLAKLEPYRHLFAHFQSEPDGGQSAAIAKGFEIATGDIMGYLNSDDVLLPGALNFIAQYFKEHPEVDFIYGHRCFIDPENNVTGHWILPKHNNFVMKRRDYIPQETCFWRRSLFLKGGNIDPTYSFAMDYDLFVRYMDITRFKRVNRFLAAFRVHSQSKTSVLVNTKGEEEMQRVQKKHGIKSPFYTFPLLLEKMIYWIVRSQSIYYLTHQKAYPGLPPGKNFNLNDVFGGLLESRKNT